MENTDSNMQNKSASLIFEMIGSGVLFICLFLPWITTQLGGRNTFGMSFDTSFSFFDGVNRMNAVGSSIPGANYMALLYFVPVLCVVNPVIQYFKRLPWLSYYTAWIPVATGFLLLYGTMKEGQSLGGFGSIEMGVGAVLSLLVGLGMQFSAWTTIGYHHKEHRTYFFIALVWFLLGIGICLFIGGSSDTDLWMRQLEGYIAWTIFASVGVCHFFFLVYGGVIALILSGTTDAQTHQRRAASTSPEVEEYLNKVRARTDEELRTILQHKEDYNERLVKAAKRVVLERASAPSPSEVSVSVVTTAAVEDDKYKSYQPSSYTSVDKEEKDYSPVSVKAEVDSFTVVKKEWKQENSEESGSTTVKTEAKEVNPSVVTPSNSNSVVLFSILGGVALAIIGALTYFLWYVPYATDRDAPRTYVVANNVFLRSSRMAGIEYNILDKIPYGSEVITYSKLGDWAEVKVNGKEGFISSTYLIDSQDFNYLNDIWGDLDTKECIESAKCRLAILDYFKKNRLTSGANGWQVFTLPLNQKPNTVFYPRLYDKYSKFTDFVFIAKDNTTGNRVLVCYSFEDSTEEPIFRFSMGAPQEGYIKNVVSRSRGVRVIYDNNGYQDLSL